MRSRSKNPKHVKNHNINSEIPNVTAGISTPLQDIFCKQNFAWSWRNRRCCTQICNNLNRRENAERNFRSDRVREMSQKVGEETETTWLIAMIRRVERRKEESRRSSTEEKNELVACSIRSIVAAVMRRSNAAGGEGGSLSQQIQMLPLLLLLIARTSRFNHH